MAGDRKLLDDRYELVRVVGEGGMGVVYEGRHVALGRKVAVKILNEEFSSVDLANQRFMQEAQIAGNLGHPNICEVTDVGTTDDGLPYMVMPFLEGRTLADEIDESEGGLTAGRAVDICVQILSALQDAHDAGIVHRDLKPENVLLTRVGDRADYVKLVDFGISKVVGQRAKELKRLTATGMVLGTPYYMAPEQAAGKKDLDARVDIYAVGVLLYELLVGRPPYEADTYNELIIKIVNEPVTPPRRLNPQITKKLERVILRAMAKEPARRYGSVSEFRQELVKAGEDAGLAIPLHLAPTGELGKNTLSTAAAEVTDRMRTVSLRAIRKTPKRGRWIAGGVIVAAVVGIGVLVFSAQRGKRRGDTSDAPSGPPAPMAPAAAMPVKPPPPPMDEVVMDRSEPMRARVVRIAFVGLPPGGRILVNGQAIKGTTMTLAPSRAQLPYRAESKGNKPVTGLLVPDRDREVKLVFVSAIAKVVRRPMVRPVPTAMAPAMRWNYIRGRQNTKVKTNYDDD